MLRSLLNVWWLACKEVRSLSTDYVMLALVIWSFTFAIMAQARNTAQEVTNASVAIADEDHSQLSRAIGLDFHSPYFKPAVAVGMRDIDRLLDQAAYTFIIVVPPHFESDVRAGRSPTLQVDIDATAAMQAGLGGAYVQQIITGEIERSVAGTDANKQPPVTLNVRLAFNPNATSGWFMAIMGLVNNITMLSIVLCGAAVIREREHGTMDHLLTLPLSPTEIATAKILANGAVILLATAVSLIAVVRGLLAVPIPGSVPLFLVGVGLYLFFALSVGLFLATLVRSMPQFGLIFMLVFVPMLMLSGGNTPIQSEPRVLQFIMQGVASTHFVSYAQAILFRGAGLRVVFPQFLIVALLGAAFFAASVARFRASASAVGG
jgi:ABC-2 type transport system permease protein